MSFSNLNVCKNVGQEGRGAVGLIQKWSDVFLVYDLVRFLFSRVFVFFYAKGCEFTGVL